MTRRGKKNNHGGGSSHGRGASYRTPVIRRSTSPNDPQQKSQSPLQAPPKRLTLRHKKPLADRFGKGDTMASAQRMVDVQRQHARYLSHIEYCGAPPTGEDLIQMRFVIPGDHLVPRALSDLAVLDDVRRESKVWITRDEGSENFLNVFSANVKSLHTALGTINQKIHDMRLSEESLTAQYFVQSPKEGQEVAISFETGKRPSVKDSTHGSKYPAHAANSLISEFTTALPSSLKTMVALPCLKMQINFGHLNILAKRKTAGSFLSQEEFEAALALYSSRGRGATIQTEFSNIEVADNFLTSVLSNNDMVQSKVAVVLHHYMRFDVEKQTVSADLQDEDGIARPISSRCIGTEGHSPLDWIISAPDMHVDWNMRVDSRPNFSGVRSGLLLEAAAEFAQSFVFILDESTCCVESGTSREEADEVIRHFKLPRWQGTTRGDLAHVSSNFQVRTCARLQYRDTPYEIETTITQYWATLPASAEPDRLSWSVSVYGIHWEEALSDRKYGGSAKGFEEDLLLRLWPGEGSLKERLAAFLECVFSVQTAIAKLQS